MQISKSLVSKEALLLALQTIRAFFEYEESPTHWLLASVNNPHEDQLLTQLYACCLEKEALLQLESKLSPLRTILYQKAFAPIKDLESSHD